MTRIQMKEIISLSDGNRIGCVGDLEFDLDTGTVSNLVVPGRLRLFGLLGREEDLRIPWSSVRSIGQDIILVEQEGMDGIHNSCGGQNEPAAPKETKKAWKLWKNSEKNLAPLRILW